MNWSVGTQLPAVELPAVRAEDIAIVALLLHDPNPIHFDLQAVAAAGLGDRVINQGGATMAYAMNFLADLVGSRSAVRRIACSFRGNVAAGDVVSIGGVVAGISRLVGGVPAAEIDLWVDVIGGRRVIIGDATVEIGAIA